MRFLVDECTGPGVARWLESEGHEVFSVYDQARGMADEAVILKAFTESWLLITTTGASARRFTENDIPIAASSFFGCPTSEPRPR